MSDLSMKRLLLEQYKAEAEDMGITLQEYLLLCILDRMDDLRA